MLWRHDVGLALKVTVITPTFSLSHIKPFNMKEFRGFERTTTLSDDDEYTIPLHDQRVFGAGIKRKRVQFVRSSEAASTPTSSRSSGPSASDFYIDLVLSKPNIASSTPSADEEAPAKSTISVQKHALEPAQPTAATQPHDKLPQSAKTTPTTIDSKSPDVPSSTQDHAHKQIVCETCHLPISTGSSQTPHAALLAHQLSLPHSHPPSSLSRTHPGLKILRSYGFDPDSRTGLGARGEGIRFPIKAKEKTDKMGIGASIPERKRDEEVGRAVMEARVRKQKEDERKRKGKGWLKRMNEEEARRGNSLQDMFYGSEDVDRYLRR